MYGPTLSARRKTRDGASESAHHHWVENESRARSHRKQAVFAWPLAAMLLLAGAVLTWTSGSATAQNLDIRTDVEQDRRESLRQSRREKEDRRKGLATPFTFLEAVPAATTAQSEPTRFSFTIDGPVSFNTNPDFRRSGERGSFEMRPTAELAFQTQLGAFVGEAVGTIKTDRFPSNSSANEEVPSGRLRLTYNGGDKTSKFKPFLSYEPTARYREDYSQHKVTAHDLVGGAKIAVPNRTPIKFGLEPSVSRRYVDTGSDSTSLYLGTSFAIDVNDDVSISVRPSVRGRLFDSDARGDRKDVTILAIGSIDWEPPWLTFGEIVGRLSLGATVSRNVSSISSVQSTQLNVGPALRFSVPLYAP